MGRRAPARGPGGGAAANAPFNLQPTPRCYCALARKLPHGSASSAAPPPAALLPHTQARWRSCCLTAAPTRPSPTRRAAARSRRGQRSTSPTSRATSAWAPRGWSAWRAASASARCWTAPGSSRPRSCRSTPSRCGGGSGSAMGGCGLARAPARQRQQRRERQREQPGGWHVHPTALHVLALASLRPLQLQRCAAAACAPFHSACHAARHS